MTTTAILLAAGLGTRMKSAMPKALHRIAGRPMLQHLLDSCAGVFDRIVVVAGPGMDALAIVAAPHPVVVQADRLGTAHAALQAAAQFGDGDVAVLYADNPLIRPATLRALLDRRRQDAGLALLAMRPAD
ncbi:MAG: NTP transferase domain-containing protein, partial [Gemmatimonadaceae bacterium]|nr:NTP transferase domain-containing protein [Acetobacteraceae bacterium]